VLDIEGGEDLVLDTNFIEGSKGCDLVVAEWEVEGSSGEAVATTEPAQQHLLPVEVDHGADLEGDGAQHHRQGCGAEVSTLFWRKVRLGGGLSVCHFRDNSNQNERKRREKEKLEGRYEGEIDLQEG
jgi:hypothetical protein